MRLSAFFRRDFREPRVFFQKMFLVFGLIFTPLMILVICIVVNGFMVGRDRLSDLIAVIVITLVFPLPMLIHGIFRRWGVDEEKVWSKFGSWFYREVRFDDITYIESYPRQYKLHAGETVITIDTNRFNWALVFWNLLHQFEKRRIESNMTDDGFLTDEDFLSGERAWIFYYITDRNFTFLAENADVRDELLALTRMVYDEKVRRYVSREIYEQTRSGSAK